MFHQGDLAATLRKLVEAESAALSAGKDRKAAIYAAYERFYRGDIAKEFVRGCRRRADLITLEDIAHWQVKIEPMHASYMGMRSTSYNTGRRAR